MGSTRIWFGLALAGLVWFSAEASAQTSSSASSASSSDPRPATTTPDGDTGLYMVPTAQVLPSGQFAISFSRVEQDMGQGFMNKSTFPLGVAVGVGGRAELFGSWHVITRIDRDTM